jgi:hypothetical protein
MAPVDLPTLLIVQALSLPALEIKSVAPATNVAGDANSSGSKTFAPQDKTFNSQLQGANQQPIPMTSDIKPTIVIPSLQLSQTQSLPALSSAMVDQAMQTTLPSASALSSAISSASANSLPQTDASQSAPKIEFGIGVTSVKLTQLQNDLCAPSTESNATSIPDSNLKLQNDPSGVFQASNTSVTAGANAPVGSHTDTAVASRSEQSTSSTSVLASSAPQLGAKLSGNSVSANAPIPPIPDLLGVITNQSDALLKFPNFGQQSLDGSSVSASPLRQKSDGSQSPSLVTSPAAQSDPRFASLLSSVTQHPTIPLPVSDQKSPDTVQKESSTPLLAFSVPATASDSSHTQDSSSANGKQNGSQSTASSAAIDGTNQFSMNMHNPVAAKPDSFTQTVVTAPVSLVSASNKSANPTASLPQTTARSLETPQQAANMPNWGGGHFVTDARLIQAPALSEMRISMRSDQLGSVEVRAHSVGDEMGAAITVEKRDAHTALSIELPALQQSLTDKHINVTRVVLTQGSLNSTTGDSHASPQQGERNASNTPFASAYLNKSEAAAGVMYSTHSVEPAVIFNSHGRLSVHA